MRQVEHLLPSRHGAVAYAGFRPVAFGVTATVALLGIYSGVLSFISGWDFAVSQFATFWYFVLPLAIGFGLQVGLFVYLRQLAIHDYGGKVVAASGATSTGAMISCCAHYLANILPVIGAAGIVTAIAEYQVELFWLGLAFNGAGVGYITSKVVAARTHMKEMRA
jgi:P-type Cu+ transporter